MVVGLLAISAISFVGCRQLAAVDSPPPSPAPPHPLEINNVTTKPWYLPGELVEVRFSWRNIAKESVKVKPFPLAVEILSPFTNNVIWSYPGGTGERKLNPDETLTDTLVWDQRDQSDQIVAPGYYFLKVRYNVTRENAKPRSSDAGYDGYPPLKILIQFPQGTVDKTITLEQTKTLPDGSSLTLERLDLSQLGAEVYALLMPVKYGHPAPKEPPPEPTVAFAQYRLDGEPFKSVGVAQSRFFEEGIELEWDLINPVRNDAKLLTFVIDEIRWQDNLGKMHVWSGPFEFQVALE